MKGTTYNLNNLTIGYARGKRRKILGDNLCAHLEKGELTCLLGTNGCGKSTLLRTMAGLQPALRGELFLMGRNIVDIERNDLAKMVSIVLTENIPAKSLTVWETVALGRMPYTHFWGGLKKEDRNIVETALQKVGMSKQKERFIVELSDGERQRVLIAKALAQNTPTILLDEPTCFLDYPGKYEILELLGQMAHREGITVLLSIHDLELALQMADCIWMMNNGSLTVTKEKWSVQDFLDLTKNGSPNPS